MKKDNDFGTVVSDLITRSIRATVSEVINDIINDNASGSISKKDESNEGDKGSVTIQFNRRILGKNN